MSLLPGGGDHVTTDKVAPEPGSRLLSLIELVEQVLILTGSMPLPVLLSMAENSACLS